MVDRFRQFNKKIFFTIRKNAIQKQGFFIIGTMEFEYDPVKSQKNKQKHGIDFEEAKQIQDGEILEKQAKFEQESRFMIIGKILEKFWTAFITHRNRMIRLISVRRSRDKEVEEYENIFGKNDNS